MHVISKSLAALGALILAAGSAQSASLRVAPTNLELIAPDSAAVLNVGNSAESPINVQVRVFRWSQENGQERLEPTNDVVASPPMIQLRSGGENLVRVVRVSKRPINGEESYRVIVDELPDARRQQAGTVSMVLRHSIPVFFKSPEAKPADITWSIGRSSNGVVLQASNRGDSRIRLADLRLSQGGRAVGGKEGLLGYVLAGSTMQWPIGARGLGGGALELNAQTDFGPITTRVSGR